MFEIGKKVIDGNGRIGTIISINPDDDFSISVNWDDTLEITNFSYDAFLNYSPSVGSSGIRLSDESKKEQTMLTEYELKHMVSRFLSWKLPHDFCPDNGIKFDPSYKEEPLRTNHWPVGTNLFTASQSEEMIKYITQGLFERKETEHFSPADKQPFVDQSQSTNQFFITNQTEEEKELSKIELEQEFSAAVWQVLKGDHNDLRKQAMILKAFRFAVKSIEGNST